MNVRARVVLALTLAVLWIAEASAGPLPPDFEAAARAHGVPGEYLYAVARAESGWRAASGDVEPWPWTLNVAGRAERYPTRSAAFVALQAHLAAERSVDIGLMQINWRWHGPRLGDPWAALDPPRNLRAGAALLRGHYEATGDWWQAIGRYHAPGASPERRARALAYRVRVQRVLERLR